MALPILPFAAGALAGGVATLIYKDEKAREALRKTRSNLSEKTRKTRTTVSNKIAESLSRLSDKLRVEEKPASGQTLIQSHTEAKGENPPTN